MDYPSPQRDLANPRRDVRALCEQGDRVHSGRRGQSARWAVRCQARSRPAWAREGPPVPMLPGLGRGQKPGSSPAFEPGSLGRRTVLVVSLFADLTGRTPSPYNRGSEAIPFGTTGCAGLGPGDFSSPTPIRQTIRSQLTLPARRQIPIFVTRAPETVHSGEVQAAGTTTAAANTGGARREPTAPLSITAG
jgi:hypothetical protein